MPMARNLRKFLIQAAVYWQILWSFHLFLTCANSFHCPTQTGEKEFFAEICTTGRLRHKNIVQLQGWCHEGEHLLLVYEHMPNGSLDRYIGKRSLDWETRFKILTGLASALLYLHEDGNLSSTETLSLTMLCWTRILMLI